MNPDDSHAIRGVPVGGAPLPGTPSRRHLLGGILALPVLGAAHRLAPSAQEQRGIAAPKPSVPREPASADLAAFYARWIPRARALVAEEEPQEDAFLYALCADVVGRAPAFFPKRRLTVFSGDGMETGPLGSDDVFQLVEIVLQPGAVIPAHNHVDYAFVTLCLEGEARVRHFEPEPGAPAPSELEQDFLVREVENTLLRPGRCSTLTRTRANVHTLVAGPEGVRSLDFGIKFPPSATHPGVFSALEVSPEPTDAARGIHAARWIGNIYARGYQREK